MAGLSVWADETIQVLQMSLKPSRTSSSIDLKTA